MGGFPAVGKKLIFVGADAQAASAAAMIAAEPVNTYTQLLNNVPRRSSIPTYLPTLQRRRVHMILILFYPPSPCCQANEDVITPAGCGLATVKPCYDNRLLTLRWRKSHTITPFEFAVTGGAQPATIVFLIVAFGRRGATP